MKLKPLTVATLKAAAMGAGATCAVSALSFAISGLTLFVSAPFIPDSAEAAIGRWTFQSSLVAGAGATTNVLCWHFLFESAGMNRRKKDDGEDQSLPLPEPIYLKQLPIKTPLVCLGCQFLNPDFSTRSYLFCAVRSCPEQDDFCPDFCSAKQVDGGLFDD